ncbi:hypothetical protein B7494_g3352 [Chlorociboria aeruginascens]|nr:hypothetical protein B7494_g3352 [Chlorociboria aeruginascens]
MDDTAPTPEELRNSGSIIEQLGTIAEAIMSDTPESMQHLRNSIVLTVEELRNMTATVGRSAGGLPPMTADAFNLIQRHQNGRGEEGNGGTTEIEERLHREARETRRVTDEELNSDGEDGGPDSDEDSDEVMELHTREGEANRTLEAAQDEAPSLVPRRYISTELPQRFRGDEDQEEQQGEVEEEEDFISDTELLDIMEDQMSREEHRYGSGTIVERAEKSREAVQTMFRKNRAIGSKIWGIDELGGF